MQKENNNVIFRFVNIAYLSTFNTRSFARGVDNKDDKRARATITEIV